MVNIHPEYMIPRGQRVRSIYHAPNCTPNIILRTLCYCSLSINAHLVLQFRRFGSTDYFLELNFYSQPHINLLPLLIVLNGIIFVLTQLFGIVGNKYGFKSRYALTRRLCSFPHSFPVPILKSPHKNHSI